MCIITQQNIFNAEKIVRSGWWTCGSGGEDGDPRNEKVILTPQDFPDNSAGKESSCHAGDLGLIPGLGRSPREGKGYPLQYSDMKNSMDCVVHGVTTSQTWLSNFHFLQYLWIFLAIISSKYFVPFSLCSLITPVLDFLIPSFRSLRASLFSFNFFSFC